MLGLQPVDHVGMVMVQDKMDGSINGDGARQNGWLNQLNSNFWKRCKIFSGSRPIGENRKITPGKLSGNKALSMSKCFPDRATRVRAQPSKPSAIEGSEMRQSSLRMERTTLLKVGGAVLNSVLSAILLKFGCHTLVIMDR